MKKFEKEFKKVCNQEGIDNILDKIKHIKCTKHNKSPEPITYRSRGYKGGEGFKVDIINLHGCEELKRLITEELRLNLD